ncbi:hypothetical protein DBR37_09050 [Herminiimonas sp. KBW02]|nr:hypothetical protein DBR37_09050 [Herminiimonas sp. KBW02]
MAFHRKKMPTLAERAWELRQLHLPDSRVELRGGRELIFYFAVSPSDYSRLYQCTLHIKMGDPFPWVVVRSPDLHALTIDKIIPHIYPYEGKGTKLCLWWPSGHEWNQQMKLRETYIAWTVEWLSYFEDWLATGIWEGGGKHPDDKCIARHVIEGSRCAGDT